MTEEKKKLKLAKDVFEDICQAIESYGLKYDKEDEKLCAFFGVRGDDLPIEITFRVYPELKLATVISKLPFKVSEDKRLEVAVALATINNNFADGSFDLNIETGTAVFRLSYSYEGCVLSEKIYKRMIELPYAVMNDNNDKLLMLSKGIIDLEKFLSEYAH